MIEKRGTVIIMSMKLWNEAECIEHRKTGIKLVDHAGTHMYTYRIRTVSKRDAVHWMGQEKIDLLLRFFFHISCAWMIQHVVPIQDRRFMNNTNQLGPIHPVSSILLLHVHLNVKNTDLLDNFRVIFFLIATPSSTLWFVYFDRIVTIIWWHSFDTLYGQVFSGRNKFSGSLSLTWSK